MSFGLTDLELAEFKTKGYTKPFKVYDPDEIKAKLRALRPELVDYTNAVYSDLESAAGITNLSSYDRHLDIEFLAKHILQRQIVDKVVSVLGPDVLCWRTEFFPKYPGDEGTDWHQAGNFANADEKKRPLIQWPEDSEFQGTITVWTAFTDATVDMGCLQFIPGTHRTMNYDESKVMEFDINNINKVDKNNIRRGFFGYDYRQLQKDPDWSPDESKAESMVMKAGESIIFWSTLMHASHPHTGKSKGMRLGYAARYLPTAVQVYPYSKSLNEYGGRASLEKFGCVLVSGSNNYSHNKFIE